MGPSSIIFHILEYDTILSGRCCIALTGALTSVPLTLLLPASYHRKIIGVPLVLIGSGSGSDVLSFLLVIFSMIFLVCGVIGSLISIQMD